MVIITLATGILAQNMDGKLDIALQSSALMDIALRLCVSKNVCLLYTLCLMHLFSENTSMGKASAAMNWYHMKTDSFVMIFVFSMLVISI